MRFFPLFSCIFQATCSSRKVWEYLEESKGVAPQRGETPVETRDFDTYPNRVESISDTRQCEPALCLEAVPDRTPPSPRYGRYPPYEYSKNTSGSHGWSLGDRQILPLIHYLLSQGVVDSIFCAFFVLELVVRTGALRWVAGSKK